VTLAEIMSAVEEMNNNVNGGVIYEYGNEYILRGVSSTDNIREIASSVVRTAGGVPVKLEDVADVKVGAQQPRLGLASEKGRPAVLVTVTKQPATGTLELTAKIEEALQDIRKNLPPDVRLSTDTFRQARFIESSIGNVKSSLLEGAIFVIIVLAIFLANARTTVISLVTLPLSMLISILILNWMGMTINTMSLGGLAIAIGSLVDDAIVDV
ncbi:Acriflavin resistance protein, partial [gut metagenome]